MDERQPEANKQSRVPRLYHTKSRNGCTRCRARRVKCDESRPVCNNCNRHSVPCEYDRPGPSSTKLLQPHQPPSLWPVNSPASSGHGRADKAPSDTSSSLGDINSRQEHWKLRALHHFTVFTSAVMPASHIPSVNECWVRHVPILALDYQPLFSALLALSASHLISMGTQDADLSQCREAWLEGALRGHRQGLDQLNKHNVDAICFTSSLLQVDALASMRDRSLVPYEPPIRWLRFVRGTRTVIEASSQLLLEDPTSVFMAMVRSYTDCVDRETLLGHDSRYADEFPHLLQDNNLDDQRDPKVAEAYRQTVNFLGSIQTAVRTAEHPMMLYRRILVFPSIVSLQFLDLVEEMAPRALIILAHFFALAAQSRDLWSIGGTPHREVRAICRQISPALHHLMEWPLEASS